VKTYTAVLGATNLKVITLSATREPHTACLPAVAPHESKVFPPTNIKPLSGAQFDTLGVLEGVREGVCLRV